MRTGYHYIISLSVRLSVFVFVSLRRLYILRELYEADFHNPGIYGSGRVWTNAWDVFPCMPSRVGLGRQAAVDFVVCFRWGGVFSEFSFSIFSYLNAHGLLKKYEATSPHLPFC